MKHQGFRYDFTAKELKIFIFGVQCPICRGKLTREKYFETKMGRDFDSRYGYFAADNQTIKYYRYRYWCPNCQTYNTLQELAEQERK